jgi:hypothetical protein
MSLQICALRAVALAAEQLKVFGLINEYRLVA